MAPLALMTAGAALHIVGQYNANMGQASAELDNAKFYREQAEFQQFAKYRELGLVARNYAAQIGRRESAYAGGNVDSASGSAGLMLGMDMARYAEEALATEKNYDIQTRLSGMRTSQDQSTSEMLGSAGYNMTQAIGTGLTAYAGYSASQGSLPGSYSSYGSGPMSPGGGSYLTGVSGGP